MLEEEGISLGKLAKLCCGYELIISSNELVRKGGDNKFDFSLKIKSLNEGHNEERLQKPKELTCRGNIVLQYHGLMERNTACVIKTSCRVL